MEQLTFEPPSKKRKGTDPRGECIFCSSRFTQKKPAVIPDISNIENLISAATVRNDKPGRAIIAAHQAGTLSDVRYHRDCRSTYASNVHVKRVLKDVNGNKGSTICPVTFTRPQCVEFDWKTNCFVCGKQCSDKHRNDWSLVESASTSGKNLYKSVLAAAEERNDKQMLSRLLGVSNEDLAAVSARYHRKNKCLLLYMSKRNIAAHTNTHEKSDVFSEALCELTKRYYTRIVDDKEVFLMKTLNQAYQEILQSTGVENSSSYKAQNLKRQLKQKWEDISIFSHKGLSDIIVCSAVTVGDVLRKIEALRDKSMEDDLTSEDHPMPRRMKQPLCTKLLVFCSVEYKTHQNMNTILHQMKCN